MRIAERHGATPAQIALAWLLSRPVVNSVIIGAKRLDQLTDNLGALNVRFEPDDLAELDKVSAEAPRYPNWMLSYNAASRAPKGQPFRGASWTPGQAPVRAD